MAHDALSQIRLDNWKLLKNDAIQRHELYNIPADPYEKKDVAAQQPDIVKSMRAEWERWAQTLPK